MLVLGEPGDGFADLLHVKRLLDNFLHISPADFIGDGLDVSTAHDDNGEVGVGASCLVGEIHPAHAGHDVVGKDQIKVLDTKQAQAVTSVACFGDGVSVPSQHECKCGSH